MPTGPGFLPTFLYYFALTTLVMTMLSTQGVGLDSATGVPFIVNPAVGVLAGLLGAYFNRTVTLSVPFQNKKTFLRTLEASLGEMGYELAAEMEEWKVYRRSPLRQVFSGKVYVKLEPGKATISSRSVHIRQLRQRLDTGS